ncbi:hypothetical protein BLS_005980, partial [Venturia inaequalis]
SRSRPPQPNPSGRSSQVQAQAARTRPPILLYRCQVPRLLHNHHGFLVRTNCCRLRRLLTGPLPANRWQGPSHRGLLVQEEV